MKKIIWTTAGVLFVSALFFLPEQVDSLWPSIFISGAAAVVYLLLISIFWVNEVKDPSKKRAWRTLIAVLVVISLTAAAMDYVESREQQNRLSEIRETIEEGVTYSRINEPFNEVLNAYYDRNQVSESRELHTIFLSKYDSLITGEREFLFGASRKDEDPSMQLTLDKLQADSIVIVGVSSVVKGKEPKFTNYNGIKGHMQVRAVLTPEGVTYEREN